MKLEIVRESQEREARTPCTLALRHEFVANSTFYERQRKQRVKIEKTTTSIQANGRLASREKAAKPLTLKRRNASRRFIPCTLPGNFCITLFIELLARRNDCESLPAKNGALEFVSKECGLSRGLRNESLQDEMHRETRQNFPFRATNVARRATWSNIRDLMLVVNKLASSSRSAVLLQRFAKAFRVRLHALFFFFSVTLTFLDSAQL